MRIVQITAGTGSFHCGTCMRDNALVGELRRQGHDAMLVPLYLDPILDEPTTVSAPLFYGGINVYLQQKSGFFRSSPRWLDRLFDAPGLLRAAAKRSGMTSARELAEITISTLRGENGNQAKELDRLVTWLRDEARPDVVCISTALLLGLARRIKAETGATVVCFLQGEDSFLDTLPEPSRTEAWSVLSERAADVDALLPVSRFYADLMIERARLPRGKVHVLYPGILLDGYDRSPGPPPDPPVLGYLARMNHLKGLGTLVEAYLLLRARNRIPGLKLRVAGTRTAADEGFVAGLQARLAEKGLSGEAEFFPNVDRDEKIRFLQGLSAFSVPATYGESFGLYVIEALAAGVPVVQPRHAAFPELVERTGGGLLCEPDDPLSLAERVEELLSDPARARAMGQRGQEVVREQFSVGQMGRSTLRILEELRATAPAAAAV